MIWDLDRYSEWNKECVEAHKLSNASAATVGACFTGRNDEPPTMVRLTVQEPPFASSTWTYTITGTESGCTISERFIHGPTNSGIRNMLRANPVAQPSSARRQMLRENMCAGLHAVIDLAETGGAP